MEEEALTFCPSFTYYTSRQSAKVAPTDQFPHDRNPLETSIDSDFTFVRSVYDFTADEIFGEDRIHQIFPVFDRDLLMRHDLDSSDGKRPTELILRALSLEKSLVDNVIGEERNHTSSLSSSELDADEIDSVPEEMYCIWRPPKVVEKSASRWKKSNSTGTSSSKHWKIRDFLHRRSNSEGTREDSFAFLSLENGQKKAEKRGIRVETTTTGKAKGKKASLMSAHEVFYVRNRGWKEGERRKSYLPYRQEIVGLFANVNAFGKTSPSPAAFWTCFR